MQAKSTQLNQIDQTTNELLEEKEFIASRKVDRKPLREWGFEVAGLNRGEPTALESHLRWIKEGHLVDENNSQEEELRRKNQIQEKINARESEKLNLEEDIKHKNEVVIKDKQERIEDSKKEIELKKIALAEGTIQSHYSAARFWLYTALCVFISLFVVFFYSSAINAAFFRSMQNIVNNGSNDDITLMLNSIFDVNSITDFGPKSIFTYLGAFIFFGFGILPHTFHDKKGRAKQFKVIAAIVVCLLVDCLLAYKIDSGIHDLKMMMNLADPSWAWYKSVNFYLVLSFGFGTYLLWGFIYEAALAEHQKKNVNARIELEIKALKNIIRSLKEEILAIKGEILELQKEVSALKTSIEQLRKDLETAALKPEELLRNMENFYAGWLGYLHGFCENNPKKDSCESVYKSFQNSLQAQLN